MRNINNAGMMTPVATGFLATTTVCLQVSFTLSLVFYTFIIGSFLSYYRIEVKIIGSASRIDAILPDLGRRRSISPCPEIRITTSSGTLLKSSAPPGHLTITALLTCDQ